MVITYLEWPQGTIPMILNNFYFFDLKIIFFRFIEKSPSEGVGDPPDTFSQGLDPKVIISIHIWSTEYARLSGGSPQNT